MPAGLRMLEATAIKQISLATEDLFMWPGHTNTPFYLPNPEALLDLYTEVVTPSGVDNGAAMHRQSGHKAGSMATV